MSNQPQKKLESIAESYTFAGSMRLRGGRQSNRENPLMCFIPALHSRSCGTNSECRSADNYWLVVLNESREGLERTY